LCSHELLDPVWLQSINSNNMLWSSNCEVEGYEVLSAGGNDMQHSRLRTSRHIIFLRGLVLSAIRVTRRVSPGTETTG